MGGNSPSHFPQEQDEGGGLTLLKGIRVSPGRCLQPAAPWEINNPRNNPDLKIPGGEKKQTNVL